MTRIPPGRIAHPTAVRPSGIGQEFELGASGVLSLAKIRNMTKGRPQGKIGVKIGLSRLGRYQA